jgi:hypothetical protein
MRKKVKYFDNWVGHCELFLALEELCVEQLLASFPVNVSSKINHDIHN